MSSDDIRIPAVPDVPVKLTEHDIYTILEPLKRIIDIRQGKFDINQRWATYQDLIDFGTLSAATVEQPVIVIPPQSQYDFILDGDVTAGPTAMADGNDPITMTTRVQMRRDTAAGWSSSDPVPFIGEWCIETDTLRTKIGDGVSAWTALDYRAVWTLTIDDNNIYAGEDAGSDLVIGAEDNIFVGTDAGRAVVDTAGNIAIGAAALGDPASNAGDGNIAIGIGAIGGALVSAAFENIAIGTDSLGALATGSENVMIGFEAGFSITDGERNVAIGLQALDALTTGSDNTAVGRQAAGRLTGENSVMLGANAGLGVTAANYNIAIGRDALGDIAAAITGDNNIAIGRNAMGDAAVTVANLNIGVGLDTLKAITIGSSNVVVGVTAGDILTTGSNNTMIGAEAGSSITTGSLNVLLGRQAGPTTNVSNELYIHNAQSDTPLIHGDFTAGTLTFNATTTLIGDVVISLGSILLSNNEPINFGDSSTFIRGRATDEIDFGTGNAVKVTVRSTGYIDILSGGVIAADELTTPAIRLTEAASVHISDSATFGLIWLKNDAPNRPYFTDDTGVDRKIVTSDLVVSGHIRAGNIQLADGEATNAQFDVDSNLVIATFETVGPTGSGADNIWATMDQMPDNATIMIVQVIIDLDPDSALTASASIWVTHGDDATPSSTADSIKAGIAIDPDADVGLHVFRYEVLIPLGATNQDFNLRYNVANSSAESIQLSYRGFMTD